VSSPPAAPESAAERMVRLEQHSAHRPSGCAEAPRKRREDDKHCVRSYPGEWKEYWAETASDLPTHRRIEQEETWENLNGDSPGRLAPHPEPGSPGCWIPGREAPRTADPRPNGWRSLHQKPCGRWTFHPEFESLAAPGFAGSRCLPLPGSRHSPGPLIESWNRGKPGAPQDHRS